MPGLVLPSLHLGRSSHSSLASVGDISASSMNKIRRGSVERASGEHKRLSFGKSPLSTKPAAQPPQPASLEFVIESPPLVFYGPASTSTGALLSGQLLVTVHERELRMDGVSVALLAAATTKKPVVNHCPECATKVSDLFRVDLLKEPTTLKPGTHPFPFSYLLPGHLPATSMGKLAVIDYKLSASASGSAGQRFQLERPLEVQRALLPGDSRTSTRIFPPTNLAAHVVLPSVIHPIGEFPIEFRIDGVVTRGKETQTRWRLRKVQWRLDEHSKMISPACAKHAHKVGGEGKGVAHQDTRTIGHGEYKCGWKTDYGPANNNDPNAEVAIDGQIEMEFQATIKPEAHPVCDVESATGMAVSHDLVLELVVAEEFCPNKNTKLVTPTGAARILRMTFKAMLTARSGLGISWDEESPPIYNDVPPSPPHYTQCEVFSGDFDYEDLERLHLH